MTVMDLVEKVGDLLTGLKVKIAGRFVCQKYLGAPHQSASNHHSLLLSARQLARAVMTARSQPDFSQALFRVPDRLPPADTTHQQRHHDILGSRELRQQVVCLPNESDPTVAKLGEPSFIQSGDVGVAVKHTSARRTVEPAKQMQQSTFPGPGLSDKRETLSCRYVERQVFKNGEAPGTGFIALREVGDADGGLQLIRLSYRTRR